MIKTIKQIGIIAIAAIMLFAFTVCKESGDDNNGGNGGNDGTTTTGDNNGGGTTGPDPTYGISLLDGTTPLTGTHTFQSVTAGYDTAPALTVTVKNTGNQATGTLTVALSGDYESCFNLLPTSLESIAVDGTGTFTVQPKIDLAANTYNATVTVSGGNGITAGFDVSFTVNAGPLLILEPSIVTFDPVDYGYAQPQAEDITVINNGTATANVTDIALDAGSLDYFELDNTTEITSIDAGDSKTFTVQPKTNLDAGIYGAIITVTYDNDVQAEAGVSFTINKADGGSVSAPSATPASKTTTSITLAVVLPTTDNDEQLYVEYAINDTDTAPSIVWQDTLEFTDLTEDTSYYFFARSKESDNYTTGAPSSGTEIKTAAAEPRDTIFNITLEQIAEEELMPWEISGGTLSIPHTSGQSVTLTLTEPEQYSNISWILGGVYIVEKDGDDFYELKPADFNRTSVGTHTLAVEVKLKGSNTEYIRTIEFNVE